MNYDVVWILRTPDGEFIMKEEPMGYDWTVCTKTRYIIGAC